MGLQAGCSAPRSLPWSSSHSRAMGGCQASLSAVFPLFPLPSHTLLPEGLCPRGALYQTLFPRHPRRSVSHFTPSWPRCHLFIQEFLDHFSCKSTPLCQNHSASPSCSIFSTVIFSAMVQDVIVLFCLTALLRYSHTI